MSAHQETSLPGGGSGTRADGHTAALLLHERSVVNLYFVVADPSCVALAHEDLVQCEPGLCFVAHFRTFVFRAKQ